MEWIISCFSDIRDWVPGQDVLCKRFREYGKLIEFCGRSNNAGLFVVDHFLVIRELTCSMKIR